MNRLPVAVLSALWFSFAPALCAAGVLTHPCDCARGLDDCGDCCVEGQELGCDCADTGCSHDTCANDPCGVTATAGLNGRAYLRASLVVAVPWLTVPFWRASAELPGRAPAAPVAAAGPARNVPYHPSDIPLLV